MEQTQVLYTFGDNEITQFDLSKKDQTVNLRDSRLSDIDIIVGILSRYFPFDISCNKQPLMLHFKRFPYAVKCGQTKMCCYGLRIMPVFGDSLVLKLHEQSDSDNLDIDGEAVSIDVNDGASDIHLCHIETHTSNTGSLFLSDILSPADYHSVA